MGVDINFSQAYFWLDSWILANILQLGTQSFCSRFLDSKMDPSRRLFDQMVMAARCGVANIAEGTSRRSTSIETEMRLLDVARASIDELQGDYFNFLLWHDLNVWEIGNPDREAIWRLHLERPQYSNSLHHDTAIHIKNQKSRFNHWIESTSKEISANALLTLCLRINRMLQNLLVNRLSEFKEKGGFTENMTSERIQAKRSQMEASGNPNCPKCGKPMYKRMQKKGQFQGREFWGCSDYPKCDGIINIGPR